MGSGAAGSPLGRTNARARVPCTAPEGGPARTAAGVLVVVRRLAGRCREVAKDAHGVLLVAGGGWGGWWMGRVVDGADQWVGWRHQPLTGDEQVRVGADDVAVGAVPAGPLDGHLGGRRGRAQVPGGDVPEESPRRTTTSSATRRSARAGRDQPGGGLCPCAAAMGRDRPVRRPAGRYGGGRPVESRRRREVELAAGVVRPVGSREHAGHAGVGRQRRGDRCPDDTSPSSGGHDPAGRAGREREGHRRVPASRHLPSRRWPEPPTSRRSAR